MTASHQNHPYTVQRFRAALLRFAGGRAAQALARLVLVLVLVRLLPVADYGAYMLMVGLSEMVLAVVSFGILPVGYRYLPEFITSLPYRSLHRFIVTIIGMQVAILSGMAALLASTWDAIMPWVGFDEEQLKRTAPGVWLFLLVPAFRFSADLLEALLEQGKAQLARALMPTGRALILGAFLMAGHNVGIYEVLIIDIFVTLFCLLLVWMLLHRSLRTLHSPGADGELPIREMARFGWHMAAVDLLGASASPGALRAVIANTLGVAEAGLFAFLQSLQRLVGRYLPGVLLRGLIRPVLVARVANADGMATAEAGTGLLFKLNLLIVGVASIIIAVGGDVLVDLLSGGKFQDAGLLLLIMFAGLAVVAQRSVIEMAMQITGQTSVLRATALLAPVALLAVWYFAKHGLEVAVLIIVGFSTLSNAIAVTVLRRGPKQFNIDIRGQAVIIGSAAVIILVCIGLMEFAQPAVAGFVGLGLFAVAMALGKPFLPSEMRLVEKVAGQRIASGLSRLFAHA